MKPPKPIIPDRLRSALGALVDAGVCTGLEVTIADTMTRIDADSGPPDEVIVAVALAACGHRHRFSCLNLGRVGELCAMAKDDDATLEWEPPGRAAWAAALRASDLVQVVDGNEPIGDRPLVFDPTLGRVWLGRYAHYETVLAERLMARAAPSGDADDPARIDAVVLDAFGPPDAEHDGDGAQRAAVASALTRRLSFITGGPGTGKTFTAGRLIDAAERLHDGDEPLRVALAAPTGKAAARLRASVGERYPAFTIHSLIGLRPGQVRPLESDRIAPYDLVVVDEASMVDLPLMTHLLGVLHERSRLVVFGDPNQLVSVEVGSVLRDIVDAANQGTGPLHGAVLRLERVHRFGAESDVGALARLVQEGGDGSIERIAALLDDPNAPDVTRIDPSDNRALRAVEDTVVASLERVREHARAGEVADAIAAGKAVKVLTATRQGLFSLAWWSDRLGRRLNPGHDEWFAGRPLMITRNDRHSGLSNGDTGVVVSVDDEPGDVPAADGIGRLRVAIDAPDGPRLIARTRLREVEDWWAMTIHKSQGSEFDEVVVSLPAEGSRILSRELFYTAVTRARSKVTVIASHDALAEVVTRRIERASGLFDRLLDD